MRFLGGKWQKKNRGKNNGNKISRFAPAFGRVVAPFGAAL
jgi:hypothetical protein